MWADEWGCQGHSYIEAEEAVASSVLACLMNNLLKLCSAKINIHEALASYIAGSMQCYSESIPTVNHGVERKPMSHLRNERSKINFSSCYFTGRT